MPFFLGVRRISQLAIDGDKDFLGRALLNVRLSDPVLSGTVSGAPAWASAQSFPSPLTVGNLVLSTTGLTLPRTFTFPDLADTVVTLSAPQTLSNKTLSAPALSGTVTGAYTLGGSPTLASDLALSGARTIGGTLTVDPVSRNVGVGTTAPQSELSVVGEIRVDSVSGRGGVAVFNYAPSGSRASFTSNNDLNNYIQMEIRGSAEVGTTFGLPNADLAYIRVVRPSGTAPFAIGIQYYGPLIFATYNIERVRIDGSGNVGVGTTAPSQKLTVAGNIGIRAGVNAFIGTLDNYALSLRTNNADRVFITNTGDVGIGTTAPGVKLDVAGVIRATGGAWTSIQTFTVPANSASWYRVAEFPTYPNSYLVIFHDFGTGSRGNSGRIVIGFRYPNYPFIIADPPNVGSAFDGVRSVRILHGSFAQPTYVELLIVNSLHYDRIITLNYQYASLHVSIYSTPTEGSIPSGYTEYRADWSHLDALAINTNDNRFVVDNNGKVGIGTTAPSQRLTVVGNIGFQAGANVFIGTLDNFALSLRTNNTDRIFITNTGDVGIGTTAPAGRLRVSGGNAIFDGNVGIGTTAPGSKLHVEGSGTQTILVKGTGSDGIGRVQVGTDSYTATLQIAQSSSNTQLVAPAALQIASGALTAPIIFYNGHWNETMRLVSGNVGIGTTAPEFRLDVAGDVGIRGNILPDADNQGNIGLDTRRWARIRSVLVVAGDYVFENGWRLTEWGDGIALLRPDGSVAAVWN